MTAKPSPDPKPRRTRKSLAQQQLEAQAAVDTAVVEARALLDSALVLLEGNDHLAAHCDVQQADRIMRKLTGTRDAIKAFGEREQAEGEARS